MNFLSSVTTAFLFAAGLFFLFRLHFFYYAHPIVCLKTIFRRQPGGYGGRDSRQNPTRAGNISPLRGLCMALAGTLGVGNIVGVASALYVGGPGSIFWMAFSGLVVSVLKYAEILLAVRHQRTGPGGTLSGGAHVYIFDSLARRGHPGAGRFLAAAFGVLCLVNALTMGSVLQINAAAGAMAEGGGGFSIPPLVTGGAMALLCAAVMAGGSRRIAAMTEKLVPFMTLGYLGLCVAVLILRRERLSGAIGDIFRCAFAFAYPDTSSEGHRALWAGLLGMITSQALKSGVMRGLVSNEAGCGTAPMAHATVRTDSPAAQGMLGIVEVFVDTVLLCTLTALCMMVSDSGIAPYGADGVSNARAAFTSVLGSWAGGVFSVSILLFAAATVFCWAHYGLTALSGLTGILGHPEWNRVPKLVFTVAFCSSLVFGSVAAPDLAWNMADTAIGLMTVLNLTFLLLEHREIAWETQRFLSDQFRHGQSARGLDRPTATNRLSGQL